MKLISLLTPEFKILKDEWFLKTMKDDWDIYIKEIEGFGENGDYQSKQWYYCLKEKINLIIDEIKKNDFIVYSDLDVQFFGKCKDFFLNKLKDKDIVFQAWNYHSLEANGGFMAIKCNENSLTFFEEVQKFNFEDKLFGDQDIINYVLKKTNINWGLFCNRIYSIGLGDLPHNILLHHACCTPSPYYRNGKRIGSLELKLKLLEKIKNKYFNFKNL